MLTLRPPSPLDLPTLYALAVDHQDKFLDDYTEIDLDYAQQIIADPGTQIIDAYGYAVGAVWFSERKDDLHASVHALINPKYYRAILKEDILGKAVDWAFDTLGVGKVLAEAMSTQSTALSLLRRYKFYEHKPFYKHTKQRGVIVDVIWFEARKNFWRKQRGHRQEEK